MCVEIFVCIYIYIYIYIYTHIHIHTYMKYMHTHTHTRTFVAATYIITIYTDTLYSKQLNSFIFPVTSFSIILPVLMCSLPPHSVSFVATFEILKLCPLQILLNNWNTNKLIILQIGHKFCTKNRQLCESKERITPTHTRARAQNESLDQRKKWRGGNTTYLLRFSINCSN